MGGKFKLTGIMKPKLYLETTIPMGKDYIVEEVRRIREEQAAKYDFDIQRILSAARKRQKKSGFKMVSFVGGKAYSENPFILSTTKRAAGEV